MNLTWERRRLAGVVMSSGQDVEVFSMDRRRPRQVLEMRQSSGALAMEAS